MRALVEMPDGSYQGVQMGAPICGEDFCDTCGDCLYCYAGDGCMNGGDWDCNADHSWVIYKDSHRWDEALALLAPDDTRKANQSSKSPEGL